MISQKPIEVFWLPCTIAGLGIIISIAGCFLLLSPEKSLSYELKAGIPFMVLIIGIFLSIFIALALYLKERKKTANHSMDLLKQNIQKEISESIIHAEEAKQKLEKALLQGQKLQAIGTLAGGIAHDFNNILYAITGYVEMAQEDVPPDSILHQNLGKVLAASHRGQDLVARILAFSRRQHYEFKPLCLKEAIGGVLDLVKPAIPASVTVSFKIHVENCEILGNQTLLHQVIVNIINNAVDAMDGEGTITIQLDRTLPDDALLKEFPGLPTCSYCKIEISDTGHGMDKTTMERIFEPFFTTKEVGKGTGLGLATVHSIVQEHKGAITLRSELGQGTTFIILFPEYTQTNVTHYPKESSDGKNSTR